MEQTKACYKQVAIVLKPKVCYRISFPTEEILADQTLTHKEEQLLNRLTLKLLGNTPGTRADLVHITEVRDYQLANSK